MSSGEAGEEAGAARDPRPCPFCGLALSAHPPPTATIVGLVVACEAAPLDAYAIFHGDLAALFSLPATNPPEDNEP